MSKKKNVIYYELRTTLPRKSNQNYYRMVSLDNGHPFLGKVLFVIEEMLRRNVSNVFLGNPEFLILLNGFGFVVISFVRCNHQLVIRSVSPGDHYRDGNGQTNRVSSDDRVCTKEG